MHANVGERIIVRGRHQGERDRDGLILETRGPDGAPPYLVRWSSDGHEALFFPESDTIIAHEAPSS
ncbi:MAG: hypothetical protein QOF82_752 [Frankiales bacterium]|jgi:hypothetical protein|nr:hypothetical protein [Frankiales bacterium]MDX6209987.1 hypothetical protein [Frankiales bacterium]MDX6211665.1 hypothetical protein [Frankiales bacterium]